MPPQPYPAGGQRGSRRAPARSGRRTRTLVVVAAAVTGVGVLALLGHLVTGPGEADRALPAPSASQPQPAPPSLLRSGGTAEPSSGAGASSTPAGTGDAAGFYGPATRRSPESVTSAP
ncbi:hypothetical protein ABZ479_14375 [Streptomyces sp. NPDC005722]